MELGTAIVGLIVVFVCVLPFIVARTVKIKKAKKLLSELKEKAESNSYKIDNYDLWNHTAIGIDDSANVLFFTKKVNSENFKQINIAEIQKSQIVKLSKPGSYNGSSLNIIEQIGLLFSFKNNAKVDLELDFYNNDFDGLNLKSELQLAEKWNQIINDKIHALKK